MIDDAVQPGAFRNVNGHCAAQVVTVTIVGDVLLDGLNRPDSRIDTRSCLCGQLSNEN
jgi:hypothetical protein